MKAVRQILTAMCLLLVATVLAETAALVHDVHLRTNVLLDHSAALLDDTHKRTNAILTHVDRVAGEVAIASRRSAAASDRALLLMEHSDQVLTTTRERIEDLHDDFHDVAVHAGTLLGEAQIDVRDVDAEIRDTAQAARTTLYTTNALLADPALKLTLENTEKLTANAAAVSGDVQLRLHQVLFPAKRHGWQRVLPAFSLARELAEFGFYMRGVLP